MNNICKLLPFSSSIFILLIGFLHDARGQSFCYPSGNVVIYSNYDGGYLNINVDQNIPDLKIGITTYEKCEVNITGPYASNVTQVIYAGYNAGNDHCNPSPPTTSILGVPSNITDILLFPPVTWPNSNGYYFIICNYSCDSTVYQGGCNTPDQIVHYYMTQFGGSLYYHYTQYGCWQDTYYTSEGGNCCIGASIIPPSNSINASFSLSNDTVCAKDSVIFVNTTVNSFPGNTTYAWDFGDGTPIDTNENPVHLYATAGSYTITLIASNSGGTASDTAQFEIVVIDCFTEIDDANSHSTVQIYPNPVEDHLCLKFANGINKMMKLYDPLGNVVLEKNLSELPIDECISFPGHLPRGIYLVLLESNGKTHSSKLIIQ